MCIRDSPYSYGHPAITRRSADRGRAINMRKLAAIFTSGFLVAACASVPMNLAFEDSIRPVEQKIDGDVAVHFAMMKAQQAYAAKRYEESFEDYQLITLKDPDNIEARIGWGNAAIALNLFDKAYEIFASKSGVKTAKDAQNHHYMAGLILAEVATGRADDDEVRLNAALEYNLDDTRLWHALGQFHDLSLIHI